MRTFATVGLLAVALAGAPAAQAGDFVVTPYGGLAFGSDVEEEHGTYGVGLGYFGDGPLGFEVDFAYAPDFFGGDDSLVPDNNLLTLMGNLVLGGRLGSTSRIYVSGGGGLMRSRVEGADEFFDIDRNDFGVNVGAGLLLGMGESLGLRTDIRYFRNIGDPEPDDEFDLDFGSFDFWRATAGLSIRW